MKPTPNDIREQKIKSIMGVDANIIDPSTEFSLVRKIAPYISNQWGSNDYANPLNNTIGITEDSSSTWAGRRPYVDAHEAGHLSWEDAGPAKLLGVSGLAVSGISDQLNNPPILDLIGGALTSTFDAFEEDRAERLSAKYGGQLGGDSKYKPSIDTQGRSDYGNFLRKAGDARMVQGAEPVLGPIRGILNSANSFFTQQNQNRLKPEIKKLYAESEQLRKDWNLSDPVPKRLVDVSKRMTSLRNEYGEDDYYEYMDILGGHMND